MAMKASDSFWTNHQKKPRSYPRKKGNVFVWFYIVLVVCLCAWLTTAITVNVAEISVVTIEVGESYEHEISANWLGLDITRFGKFEGSVDTNKVGSYHVTYTPPFRFKEYSVIVNVVDKQKPTVTLHGDAEMFVDSFGSFVEPGYDAVDNYDGDLTEYVQKGWINVSDSEVRIDYFVTDSSRNFGVATRTLKLQKGVVYLTFDDGPSYDTTPKILDILAEKGVKATFFVVGFNENKEYLIKRIHDEGHTIGYHGYSHDYNEVYKSPKAVMENFYKVEERVLDVTGGSSTKIVRFPGGSSNTVSKRVCLGVVSEAAELLEAEQYVYFDWNVDSQDAGGAKSAEEVFASVTGSLKRGRNVVLMHDFSGNSKSVEALGDIIDYCFKNGYEFRTLNYEVQPVQHKIAN